MDCLHDTGTGDIGDAERSIGVELSVDVEDEAAPGPAATDHGAVHTGDVFGGVLGGVEVFGFDAVKEVVGDLGADLVADVEDEQGAGESSDQGRGVDALADPGLVPGDQLVADDAEDGAGHAHPEMRGRPACQSCRTSTTSIT